MLKDMGTSVLLEIQTDSSSAKAMCGRRGVGKVRHLQTPLLWIQDRVQRGDVIIKKIDGKTNSADLGTKVLAEKLINTYLKELGFHYREGLPTGAKRAQL